MFNNIKYSEKFDKCINLLFYGFVITIIASGLFVFAYSFYITIVNSL